jgi:hypothetical protein
MHFKENRMKLKILSAALAAGALTACGDTPPQPRVVPQPAASQPAGTGATSSSSSTTPASSEERKDGANPVQQQVDPKEAEQRRGFQHPNDKNGPTSPETQPKTGG